MGCRPCRVKRALGKCPPTLPGDAGERRKETAQLSEWAAFTRTPRPWQAIAAQAGADSFISTSPDTISSAATIRIALAVSPRTAMPTRNAPTAPIPVQMV